MLSGSLSVLLLRNNYLSGWEIVHKPSLTVTVPLLSFLSFSLHLKPSFLPPITLSTKLKISFCLLFLAFLLYLLYLYCLYVVLARVAISVSCPLSACQSPWYFCLCRNLSWCCPTSIPWRSGPLVPCRGSCLSLCLFFLLLHEMLGSGKSFGSLSLVVPVK